MSMIVQSMFRYPLGDDAALIPRTMAISEAYHELTMANRQRLARWEPWAARRTDLAGTRDYLKAGARAWLDGAALPTAIAVPAGAGWRLVGSAGLRINKYSKVGGVGYWIDDAFEGRGLVSRAVAALLDQAFGPLALGRVALHAQVENNRSRAVARRLGFTEEGVHRAAIAFDDGDRRDEVVYAMLPADWRTGRADDT